MTDYSEITQMHRTKRVVHAFLVSSAAPHRLFLPSFLPFFLPSSIPKVRRPDVTVRRSVQQFAACHASPRTLGKGNHAAWRVFSQLHLEVNRWQFLCSLTHPCDVIAFRMSTHSFIHCLFQYIVSRSQQCEVNGIISPLKTQDEPEL